MTSELEQFLDVVDKVSASVADSGEPLIAWRRPLVNAGLLDLGRDTAQESDSLHWVTHTVRIAAESSPALAYVLSARYAADRALGADHEVPEPTFALGHELSPPVAAKALEPETVLVLDAASDEIRATPWGDLSGSTEDLPRTGLAGARLATLNGPLPFSGSTAVAPAALGEWELLTSAVQIGLARRAVRTTQAYVLERHQFGVPIASFAGLRALVADMDLKVEEAQALLEQALGGRTHTAAVAAASGRMARDVCIDAIQSHGGYGYIDEYPLAGLLRDAVSVEARSGGRRFHLARLAEHGLGPTNGAS